MKKKEKKLRENSWKKIVEKESAERILTDGCTFKILAENIIHIGKTMLCGSATPKDVQKLMEMHDAMDSIVGQFKHDVSTWAGSFSFGEEEK
tara:strand:+ start:338 stop:613 length:276 start_codon:yes stop_codon:yes gene_type:complete